jgi:hypothetical protein
LRIFDDGEAGAAAKELEKMAEAADLRRASVVFAALEQALGQVQRELTDLESRI